ncbi:hypothetical protein X777_05860, partial [Ooceraea biroi]
ECFLRLSFFNALMEMKSLRMKTTTPTKAGVQPTLRANLTPGVTCPHPSLNCPTSLLSHVRTSRLHVRTVLPETIRPGGAMECVNTPSELRHGRRGRDGGGSGGGGGDGGRGGGGLIFVRGCGNVQTGCRNRVEAEIVSGKITGDGRFIDVETITIGVCPTMR